MTSRFRWAWIGPILLYVASGLEVLIMISPFAAYFYSVYAPLLNSLLAFPATAWLPQFFLPHLTRSDHLLFQGLEFLGPALAGVGVIGFLVCAAQLYYGKFVRKSLVTSGLYGRVRHPQYLCLAVGGLGFLLMWPRFFILLTYLLMLGFYYLLARHEEETVLRKYGKESSRYMARIAMFNPFHVPGSGNSWQPPARSKAFMVWIGLVVVGMGAAFLLRNQAAASLYAIRLSTVPGVAIAFVKRPVERITTMASAVLATQEIRARMQSQPGETYLLQIATGKQEIEHLLTDLGMKVGAVQSIPFFDEDEYAVVSRLTGRTVPVDPFALDTQIEPLMLARPDSSPDRLEVRAFLPEQFYPDFARVMF